MPLALVLCYQEFWLGWGNDGVDRTIAIANPRFYPTGALDGAACIGKYGRAEWPD